MAKQGPAPQNVFELQGGGWVGLYKTYYQLPDGKIANYDLIVIPNYVATLPFRHAERGRIEVLLFRHFRAAAGWVVEACKGIGINLQETAEREIAEEAGIRDAIRHVHRLYSVMPMPDRGVSSEPLRGVPTEPFICNLCLTEVKSGFEPGRQNLEDEEFIEVVGWITLKDAERRIQERTTQEPIDPYLRLLIYELRAKYPHG